MLSSCWLRRALDVRTHSKRTDINAAQCPALLTTQQSNTREWGRMKKKTIFYFKPGINHSNEDEQLIVAAVTAISSFHRIQIWKEKLLIVKRKKIKGMIKQKIWALVFSHSNRFSNKYAVQLSARNGGGLVSKQCGLPSQQVNPIPIWYIMLVGDHSFSMHLTFFLWIDPSISDL